MSTATARKARRTIEGYLFIAPVVFGLLIWTFGPMLLSLYYSFTKYDILSPPQYVGVGNYVNLFQDPSFMGSVLVTVTFTVISVPLGLILGLGLALLLNQRVPGMRIFRTIFYLPVVVPAIVSSELWGDIFSPNQYGIVNTVLMNIHLIKQPYPFFTNPSTAMLSLIYMSLWGMGGGMLIWLAGLQGVPQELYEAAKVDGAGVISRFFRITLPMITPTIFFNMIVGMIGTLQVFVQSLVLGGIDGNPLGSLDFIALFIYRHAFSYFQMGFAAAAGWVLFVFILILTMIIFLTSGKWVYYEGEAQR